MLHRLKFWIARISEKVEKRTEKDDLDNTVYERVDEKPLSEKERLVLNQLTDINFVGNRKLNPYQVARAMYNIQRIIEKNIYNSK